MSIKKLDLDNNPYTVEIDYRERTFYINYDGELNYTGQFDSDMEIYEHSVFIGDFGEQIKLTESQFVELSNLIFENRPDNMFVEVKI